MLTWPHAESGWEGDIGNVEQVFLEITRHTYPRQTVLIVCNHPEHRNHVSSLLVKNDIPQTACRLFTIPSNDSWARDHGPITVLYDDNPVLLDFTFNGWGHKYPAHLDNKITGALHEAGAFGATAVQAVRFILEGGSIETDGLGTVLTTTSCLLSQERNRGMDRNAIEQVLLEQFGAERILWLEHGILPGDDTDGHIDTLARFTNPQSLVFNQAPDIPSLNSLYNELQRLTQKNGNPYQLVPLPVPFITNKAGNRLPATYTNFLIINDAVLVPTYATNTDQQAIDIFTKCFSDRKIIGIDCRPLINQFGSLHCATMNLPKGVIN